MRARPREPVYAAPTFSSSLSSRSFRRLMSLPWTVYLWLRPWALLCTSALPLRSSMGPLPIGATDSLHIHQHLSIHLILARKWILIRIDNAITRRFDSLSHRRCTGRFGGNNRLRKRTTPSPVTWWDSTRSLAAGEGGGAKQQCQQHYL